MDQYCALSGGGGRGSCTAPPPQAAPPLPGPQIAWPCPRPYRTLSDKQDLREALLLSSRLSLQSKQTLPAWHKRHLVRAAGDGPNLRWGELLIVLGPLFHIWVCGLLGAGQGLAWLCTPCLGRHRASSERDLWS